MNRPSSNPPGHVSAIAIRSTLAATLLATSAVASTPATAQASPPDAQSLNALMALAHAASAFRGECAAYLSEGEVQRTFDSWQARNKPLLDRVRATGRNGGGQLAQAWDRQQVTDAALVREQVAGLIRPSPQSACRTAIGEFNDGTYDLAKFPEQLRSLDP